MTTLNKVIICGRLTRDTETKDISGTQLCKFGLAFDSGFGEKKAVVFIDVDSWGKTAEFIAGNFSKGKEILIEGRLEFQQWEKDGEKRSKHTITAERVSFVGAKDQQGSDDF